MEQLSLQDKDQETLVMDCFWGPPPPPPPTFMRLRLSHGKPSNNESENDSVGLDGSLEMVE